MAIAFGQLQDAYPEANIEIVSLKKKGRNRDKLHIKADTSTQADYSVLHAQYFPNLDDMKSLSPEAMQALLADIGATINLLSGLL